MQNFVTKQAAQNAKHSEMVIIPIIGTIAAGHPIEAIENVDETISVSDASIRDAKKYYALRVVGDSMIDDGIFDGDIVIIKKQSTADDGQTIVAIIDENQATLKRIYREANQIRLQPRNPGMQPLFRSNVEIRGVVARVIHRENADSRTTIS